jgi:hypothetical protein
MAKSMKVVRNVMLNTLTDGGEGLQVPLSTNMAKVITPLAMQPMVAGMDINDIKDKTNPGLMEMKYTYFKIFYDFPVFMAAYEVFFVILGVWIGYYFTKRMLGDNTAMYNTRMVQMMTCAIREVRRYRQPRYPITLVDDWDQWPKNFNNTEPYKDQRMRTLYPGEEYFRETETGLERYV